MNYIYDIYLNFNDVIYDFFDWNKNDKLIHIRKIPIIKIDEDSLKDLIKNKIIISEELLVKLYNKTEILDTKKKINYCALFTDESDVIAISFNQNGLSEEKSFLYIDEELEVLDISNKLCFTNIDYKVFGKDKFLFKTRKQIFEEEFIKKELKDIEENKLNYVYYECFGKQEKKKSIILKDINKISKDSEIYKNLYNILKLTSKSK